MKHFAAFSSLIFSHAKKVAATAALLLLLCASASAQYFYIYNPSASQSYTQGTTMTITWGADQNPGYVSHTQALYVSSNGGGTWTLIEGNLYGYQRSYDWAIPINQPVGSNYYIMIDEDYTWYPYGYDNQPGFGGPFSIIKACTTPVVTTPIAGATVCTNTSYTFSVASDMSDGTYQWKKDGNVVATTTTPSYTINPVNTGHAGNYTVTLTDACSTPGTPRVTTSGPAILNVILAPVITKQPQPTVAICQSGRDTLRASGTGAGRTFQWQKDGVNIPFATDTNYVVDNAQLTSSGSYRLVVSGTCTPPAISDASVVSVVVRPVITTEPTSLALCPGSSGQLSVVATGLNLTYQWYKNGVALPANSSTLAFTNYSNTQDGLYSVDVRTNVPNPNNCQVLVSSRIVTVTGYRPPTIVTQPKPAEGCVGKSVSLTSEFDGFGLNYVWTRNGAAIANSGSNSLLLNNLTTADAGDYVVTATGTCGLSVTSNPVRVNIVKTPTFSTQPQSNDLTAGQPLTLTVAASDATSIKWYKDGKLIAGQNGTTLTIPSVTPADAGYYYATVTNACSGITSAYARVTVIDPSTLQPRLTMLPESADLGQIPVGYDASRTFTNLIQNTGTADLQVLSITISGTGFVIATAPTTPFTLAPGASATVTVRANAENLTGMNGVLTVTTNAAVSTGLLTLMATPVLRYNAPADVNFGAVIEQSTKDSCIVVMNTSTTDISLEQVTISGPNANMFSIVTPTPISIAAGVSGEICVKFAPTSVSPNLTAQLNFTSSTGGNTTMTLNGEGKLLVGVSDVDLRSGVSVYPNPARDEVSIRTATPATITIVNARGMKVASLTTSADRLVTTWNTKNFNGTAVAAGTYSVQISGQQGTVTVPLVVVR